METDNSEKPKPVVRRFPRDDLGVRRLLKKPEVAEILGCTLRGVDLLVASGKLRKRAIAKRIVRFSPDDLERMIDNSIPVGGAR